MAAKSDLPPIPCLDVSGGASNYRTAPFDGADPRAAEPLRDLAKEGIAVVPFYHLADGSNPPYGQRIKGSVPALWCREGLLGKLHEVNGTLAAHDCEIVVYDAYRPVSAQHGLWTYAIGKIARDHPDLSAEEVETLTGRYSSDPRSFEKDNPTTWPTHATGASLDVMLRSCSDGALLDMGTHFDDLSELSHTDHFERQLRSGVCRPDHPALRNRRLLYWTMASVGFIKYPAEFWHFDHGNQMFVTNAAQHGEVHPAAWYGYVEPPRP